MTLLKFYYKYIGCLALLLLNALHSQACTSAIVSAEASASGRPLLWKHRDTSTTDNKVEYVAPAEGTHGYVALFNAKDRHLEEAWIGFNDAGFAVMNTASYNIKNDRVPQSKMDKEGVVMTLALKHCITVDDFEELLRTLPRPMGVEANFGVIDAYGNGAFFETNNDSFVKFDLADAPSGVLIRTNYSHSGRKGEGYGHIREANAEKLISDKLSATEDDAFGPGGKISPEFITEKVSRCFYHDLRGTDALHEGIRWAVDEDFIPRYKSTATVVIEGILPMHRDETPDSREIVNGYVMWCGLGYPPCSEIVPVWCHDSGVAEELRGIGPNGTSPMGNKAKQRRSEVFAAYKGRKHNEKYIDLTKLQNQAGTGYLQVLVPQNLEIYRITRKKRENGEFDFRD